MSPSRYKMLERVFVEKGIKRGLTGSRLVSFVEGGIIAHVFNGLSEKYRVKYGNGRKDKKKRRNRQHG